MCREEPEPTTGACTGSSDWNGGDFKSTALRIPSSNSPFKRVVQEKKRLGELAQDELYLQALKADHATVKSGRTDGKSHTFISMFVTGTWK